MQEIKIYVAASDAAGVIRDYANARNVSAPSLVKGIETCLKLRLFTENNNLSPYPIEQLASVASWEWVMDRDFNSETNYILVADNSKISVDSVVEKVDGTEYTYTEVSIPLPNTNTVELNDWLGKDKSKTGLTAELVGYDASGSPVFVLQLENFTVRNRLTGSGDPTELPEEYLTEAQVRAVISGTLRNPIEFEYSTDGVSWHDTQTADDVYYRQRIANISADWSEAVMMRPGSIGQPGADGKDGADGYTPKRGVDYWTDADKNEIKTYVENAILNGEW